MVKDRRRLAPVGAGSRLAAVIALCGALLAVGCKTSQDAAAAATQMSATAKSLSDYYTALGTILANTDKLYILNDKLYDKPYTPENRQLMKTNQAELAKRAALAADFSTLASGFASLSGSTAPADVAASAAGLQSEVDTLTSHTSSTVEQTAMSDALKLLVTAVQEHKEREAAKAIDGFAKGLKDLFIKEEPVWSATEQVYTAIASTTAGALVDANANDSSGMLKVALHPFGLTPSVPAADLSTKLAPLAKQQIVDRHAELDNAYAKATAAMQKSLEEMADRVHTVAQDKPLAFRAPPLTLSTVEQWANQIAAF